MATGANLKDLSEKEFTRLYLVPLYKAKGYQDVEDYHGGQTEQGKDITMWKFDAEHIRENYSVVVKAGDITGSASGRGSANEVSFQVRQCFKVPFSDKRTGEERVVQKCFVVASGKIGNNSRTTIRGSLDSYLDRYVTFFDGSEILAQFAEFCPEKNAVEEFLRTSVALQNQLKGVEVSAKIASGVRELLFRRTEGASESEKRFLQLDLNLEAINEEMRARFKAFDEEGGSISLPKAVFKIVRLPEILEQFGVAAQHIGDLSFTQIPNEVGTFTFRKSDEENQGTSLEHISLSVIKSGSARVQLATKDDTNACKFTLDFDRNAQTVTFSFTPLILGQNSFAVYKVFAFVEALSKRGNLSLVSDQTGVAVIDELIEGVLSKVSPLQLSLLRKLATIQQKTGKTIVVKRAILGTDIPDIENAFIAVTEGKLYFELEPIIIHARPGENRNHYPRTPNSYVFLPPDKQHIITIVDNDIDLGETEIIANNAVFEIDEGSGGGKLIPLNDEPFYINFVRYSGERKLRLPSDHR